MYQTPNLQRCKKDEEIVRPYGKRNRMRVAEMTTPFPMGKVTNCEYPPDQSHPTQWMYGTYTSETVINQFLGGTGILTGIVTA